MSLTQYNYVFRVSLNKPIYLLPVNNTTEFWLKHLNKTIVPKHNIIHIINPPINTNLKRIKEMLVNLRLMKYVPKLRTNFKSKATYNYNTVIDFEPLRYLAEKRAKSNIKRQIDIINNIIAEVIDTSKEKALIIAFDIFNKPEKVLPYSRSLLYGLALYGNVLFDLFDVILFAFTISEDKIKYYVIKSNFKEEVDYKRVASIFKRYYALYLMHNNILNIDEYEQLYKDTEENDEELHEDRIKEHLIKEKLYKKIDLPKPVDHPGATSFVFTQAQLNLSTTIFTEPYKYPVAQSPKVIKVLTDEKIPKPVNRIYDYDLLPFALKQIIELKGIKVLGMSYTDNKVINSTKDTITRTYHIDIQLPNGNKDRLNIDVPLLIDKYYYYIGGTKKILLQQIINKPIIYIGNHTTLILTHRQSMRVTYKKNTFEWYVVGLKVNPIIPFAVHNRLESFASKFGYSVKVV